MTAPLFLLDQGALGQVGPGDLLVLDGAEGRHAATVRRMAAGERVRLADGSGRVAYAVVQATRRDALEVVVHSVRHDPVPGPAYTLVQALAKGDRDLQAIESATELGVDRVVPWQAERSIVQWRGERGRRAHRKWETTVRAAAKQSRRATVPPVEELVDRGSLTERVRRADLALVLHQDADRPLTGIDLPAGGEVLLVVGPEGGISPAERDALDSAGARTARLGETVLRASSAGPAALAVLVARSRW